MNIQRTCLTIFANIPSLTLGMDIVSAIYFSDTNIFGHWFVDIQVVFLQTSEPR